MIDQTVDELAGASGRRAACAALGRSRDLLSAPSAQPASSAAEAATSTPAACTECSRTRPDVLGVLHHERFVDQAPARPPMPLTPNASSASSRFRHHDRDRPGSTNRRRSRQRSNRSYRWSHQG